MKYSIIIDKEREEEVMIYAHERNETIERLEAVLKEPTANIVGVCGDSMIKITPDKTICFTLEDSKTYAVTESGKYQVKLRLYVLEEMLGNEFVKINQSCLVNVSMIESFNTSLGGSLMVILKGGYRDYISRRQVKAVKERIGF